MSITWKNMGHCQPQVWGRRERGGGDQSRTLLTSRDSRQVGQEVDTWHHSPTACQSPAGAPIGKAIRKLEGRVAWMFSSETRRGTAKVAVALRLVCGSLICVWGVTSLGPRDLWFID